jgi:hypothetical protein
MRLLLRPRNKYGAGFEDKQKSCASCQSYFLRVPKNVYFYTSILASYYCPKTLSELAERKSPTCKQPVISQLTLDDIKSALSHKKREKNLSRKDGNRILNQIRLNMLPTT